MRNMKSSVAAAGMRPVKKEHIVMDLDSDDEDVLCGEMNECMRMDTDVSIESGEANPSNMQMTFCANDDDWDNKIDPQYLKLFDSMMDDGNSYLSDNPLRCIRYEVDNGGYDTRVFKDKRKSREDRNTGRATKKNVVVSRPPHRVQASTKKTREFVLRRRESPVNDMDVDAKVSHARRNSQYNNVEARKKKIREVEMVPDEHYRAYLTSLVEKGKSSRTNPEKEIQVKCEEDAMSLSDSDSIEVDDRPFLDDEDSPFVASKSYKVVDLEEESDDDGDQCSSRFRKEIMNVLKQPYNEKEFKELEHEASVCRWLTKSKELLDGREFTYTTNQKKPSYLDQYPEFKRKLERALDAEDRHRALNLLRGFIFYLTKVARHDAFKPWLDHECLKITCF